MVGQTLGHYEILELLGAGGMGKVYRARDANLRRDVAIKVLPEDLAADAARLARMEREAHLLASLNHPNVASIYSLEESGGVRWLVLELLEGEDLEQRLRSGRLPVEDALEIGRQVAMALDAAHKQGIVHRDLKPANVMLDADGVVKVLDFGIAKAPLEPLAGSSGSSGGAGHPGDVSGATEAVTSAEAALTATGVLVGTAPYMSPEQIRGKPVDKRSDNWAFGCLMFELLSGQRPFLRETVADTLSAILEHEPDWRALPADLPEPVRALIQRCLQKDADMRLQDIADGRVAIDEIRLSGTIPSGVQPRPAPAFTPRISKRTVAGLVGLLSVVSLLVAYGVWGPGLLRDPWPASIRVSGAGAEINRGAYGQISRGIGELIERDIGPAVEWSDPRDHGGVATVLGRMDAGELDLAIVQNDAAFHAVMTDEFLGYRSGNIAGLAALYPELLHIVVRNGSGIAAVEDLRGKTIAVGSGFGARSSSTLLSRFDIDEAAFTSRREGAEVAVPDGEMLPSIDVVMQWASVPAVYLDGILRRGDFTLVPIPGDVVGGLRATSPFFRQATIPPRVYPRQTEAVPTVAVTAILVASTALPDDLVERILEAMFANVAELIASHPRAADISLATGFGLENGMTIDLHPGAEAFRRAHADEIEGRR